MTQALTRIINRTKQINPAYKEDTFHDDQMEVFAPLNRRINTEIMDDALEESELINSVLVPPAFEDIYVYYLLMNAAEKYGEENKHQIYMERFNDIYSAYFRWYIRHYGRTHQINYF